MNKDEYAMFLNALKVAKENLSELSSYAVAGRDDCEDYSDGYSLGIEHASEELENFIDDLEKIVKSVDIRMSAEKRTIVADSQKELGF